MVQPASRTRFYRDKRSGKVNGLCAGIADYTGIDVTLVRWMMIFSVFFSGGGTIPLYFVAGWISPDRPRELDRDTVEQQEFWKGVRASPARSARAIGSRLREVDRRLADIDINDAALAASLIDRKYGENLMRLFNTAAHGRALAAAGFEGDLAACAAVDSFPVIPIYQDRLITKLGPERER